AVAVWHMADLKDSAGKDSKLTLSGEVKLGVELAGAEKAASLKRGGDGKVAELQGGWLDAGQGADKELNLTGNAMSLCIRLRDPSGKWNTSLLSKHGGHPRLVYNLFSVDLGSGMDLGFELGTDKGMFQVSLPTAQFGGLGEWHDIIARYDGKRLELFVDGVLRDWRAASGKLRTNNPEPCLIGAESHDGKPVRPFHGFIDHAALW